MIWGGLLQCGSDSHLGGDKNNRRNSLVGKQFLSEPLTGSGQFEPYQQLCGCIFLCSLQEHYNTPQSAMVTSTLGVPSAEAASLSAEQCSSNRLVSVWRMHTDQAVLQTIKPTTTPNSSASTLTDALQDVQPLNDLAKHDVLACTHARQNQHCQHPAVLGSWQPRSLARNTH
jgi:hypothetical protein